MPKTIDDEGVVTLNIDADDLVQLAIRLGVLQVPEGWTLKSAWESSWTLPNSYLKITAEFAPPRPSERDPGELCDAFDRRFDGDTCAPATGPAEPTDQPRNHGLPDWVSDVVASVASEEPDEADLTIEQFRKVVRAAHDKAHITVNRPTPDPMTILRPVRRRYTRTAVELYVPGSENGSSRLLPYLADDTPDALRRRLCLWSDHWARDERRWSESHRTGLAHTLERWLKDGRAGRAIRTAEDSWYPLDPADLVESEPPR